MSGWLRHSWQRIGLIWGGCAILLGAQQAAAAAARYSFGVNETNSLPDWAFITDLQNRRPQRGQEVQFVAPDNRYYPHGARFVKKVWGVPGDLVTRVGRTYFVNGRSVGYAKEHSQEGFPTNLGPTGVIPPEHYYVGSESRDGFDSRYAEIGWIGRERVVGVSTPVL